MAPTYLCRFPGSASYGRRGSALFNCCNARTILSRHPEVRAKRASKGDGPSASAGILRGLRCAQAPQDDGSRVETISNEKAELRVAAQARRDGLPADARKAAAETIAARNISARDQPGHDHLRLHAAQERDQSAAADAEADEAGARLALPAIAGRGKPLIMRAWEFGAPLDRGQWGIREPKPDAPEVEPDILLVPLAGVRSGRVSASAMAPVITI